MPSDAKVASVRFLNGKVLAPRINHENKFEPCFQVPIKYTIYLPDYYFVLSPHVLALKHLFFFKCQKLPSHSLFICSCLCFFAFCDVEKQLLYLNVIFLHNCTYLTFDLTVPLNQKIKLVIHPYFVCNSLSSLDAEH